MTAAPEERVLPSGTRIVTSRVSVPREERTAMVQGSRQSVDWVDLSAWSGRARRAALRWRVGDIVQVEGALRRRYPGTGPAAARVEIEVLTARLVQRAAAPPRG